MCMMMIIIFEIYDEEISVNSMLVKCMWPHVCLMVIYGIYENTDEFNVKCCFFRPSIRNCKYLLGEICDICFFLSFISLSKYFSFKDWFNLYSSTNLTQKYILLNIPKLTLKTFNALYKNVLGYFWDTRFWFVYQLQ